MSWKALNRENSSWPFKVESYHENFSCFTLRLRLFFIRAFNKHRRDLQIHMCVLPSLTCRDLWKSISPRWMEIQRPQSPESYLAKEVCSIGRFSVQASLGLPPRWRRALIINRSDTVGLLAEIRLTNLSIFIDSLLDRSSLSPFAVI